MRRPQSSKNDARKADRPIWICLTTNDYNRVQRICRTVMAPYSHRIVQLNSQFQRRKVTLSVPTFPLPSKARRLTVCSPGASAGRSTEYRSCPLSAIPSSGKQRSPGRAIKAEVSPLYFAGGVVNIENVHRLLSAAWPAVNARKTGGVLSMSTGSLNRSPDKRLPSRIIGRVRSDDFDDVASIGERGAVDRVKVVAQLVLQQPKRSFV